MQGSRTENKKIKNASPLEYDGISFKSKLEKMAYQTLKEQGFPVQYEPKKFIIWEGFRPNVPFYNKDTSTRMLKMDSKKVIDMKGFENNTYPLKKKIFRKWLESNYPNSIYFEIFTKKQLLQAIDIIKNLN